jgi:hypothetical protein
MAAFEAGAAAARPPRARPAAPEPAVWKKSLLLDLMVVTSRGCSRADGAEHTSAPA